LFPHGGTYWLFADYTRPGAAQSVSRFRVEVEGVGLVAEALRPDGEFMKVESGLQVRLNIAAHLYAGEDIAFRFEVPVDDLEPYLGAWAHIMIVSEDRREFIHAHPADDVGEHTHQPTGPSPKIVSAITGFRKPGLYRLWVQFQRQGRVITVPYTINVEPARSKPRAVRPVPKDAVRVRVSSSGFEPARIDAVAGRPTVLAFERQDAQNCANTIVFPELGIRKALPAGETVLIEIDGAKPRELHFACGMSMYRGAVVIR
jgi:hypothetical protein